MSDMEFREAVSALDTLDFLRFVAETCPCAIFLIGPDSTFHYVNKAAAESTGYTRDELLHMGVPDIDPWYNTLEWPHHFKEVRNEGVQKLETRHRRKDGSLIAVEIYTHFLKIDGGEYLCAFASDITIRAENSEKLAEMATRFEFLFNHYPTPVMVIDENGMLLGVNPSACDALGYNLLDMIGKTIDEFMAEESKVHFDDMFVSVLKEDNVRCEITYLKKDGGELKTTCSPIVVADENEDIKSILLFFEVL